MLTSPKSLGITASTTILFTTIYTLAAHQYQVDSLHSSVTFAVPVAGGLSTLQGRFNKFAAVIEYDPDNAARSSVHADIDVSSLDTGVLARDKHTLGKDGFDIARFPNITFNSKRVFPSGDGFDCVGDLTLRGVKKEVSIHFRPTGSRTINEHQKLIGFQGGFKIDRREYGMNWQMAHNSDWIGNTADIQVNVLARPK